MSLQIQDGILHGLLTFGPDCWYEFGSTLHTEMFDGERREIYDAIAETNRAGEISDLALIAQKVSEDNVDLVHQIAFPKSFVSKASMPAYCSHLREAYQVSRARDIGADLMETGDFETAKSLLMAMESGKESSTVDAHTALVAFQDDLENRQTQRGLMTGLADLDKILCGLEPADLCLIAARPSMGKTALMLNIAENVGVPVGIFSLEMSTPQLMTRLVSSKGVDYGRLRWPKSLQDSDWPKITGATKTISQSGILINDTAGLSISTIESEAWRMVKGKGIQLICIDYAQLITCKAESSFESLSEISRRLKGLAKTLKIPVVALCQLNRAIEGRGKWTPRLSDLRGSGQFEQDADQIIFINRDEVHVEDLRPGEADLIVAKNRSGEIGKAIVAWQGHYQRFVNLEHNQFRRASNQ